MSATEAQAEHVSQIADDYVVRAIRRVIDPEDTVLAGVPQPHREIGLVKFMVQSLATVMRKRGVSNENIRALVLEWLEEGAGS